MKHELKSFKYEAKMKKLFLSLLLIPAAQGMSQFSIPQAVSEELALHISKPSSEELNLYDQYQEIIQPQLNTIALAFTDRPISWQAFNEIMMYAMLGNAIQFTRNETVDLDTMKKFNDFLSYNAFCAPFAKCTLNAISRYEMKEIGLHEILSQIDRLAKIFSIKIKRANQSF